MQAIIDTIVAFGDWLLGLVKAVITAIWDFCGDVIAFIFDKLLSFGVTALNAMDVSAISGQTGAWGSIPAEVMNILGLIGLGQCFAIIAAALVIRFGLQLIPFVRLGS